MNNTVYKDTTRLYNFDSGMWTDLPPMPSKLAMGAAALLTDEQGNRMIVVAGGSGKQYNVSLYTGVPYFVLKVATFWKWYDFTVLLLFTVNLFSQVCTS